MLLLALPCFLVPVVISVPEPWGPSEYPGEDQPGHRIHLRTGFDQAFEVPPNCPTAVVFKLCP